MKETLLELEKKALKALDEVRNLEDLETFRVTYIGKKGLVTGSMRKLGELPPEERPEAGKLANMIKGRLSKRHEEMRRRLEAAEEAAYELPDVTLPGREPLRGHLHPITQVIREVCQIFGLDTRINTAN